MSWKRLLVWDKAGLGSGNVASGLDRQRIAPIGLLQAHDVRLNALRLESGYDSDAFQRLVGSVMLRVAEWIYVLPASRSDNHCETAGLLRFAIESACLGFRRADGKFLAGPSSGDLRNRERDRGWRYAAMLGGLLRPLGRCATHLRVTATQSTIAWNPLHEALWEWQCRLSGDRPDVQWRNGVDARPVCSASTWIAARVIPSGALAYLQGADEVLPEMLLRIISGEHTGRLCEIVEEACQAAIDQDISRRSTDNQTRPAVHIEHRLLEAVRGLCREKWTVNTPGGRLWFTGAGVFLVWRPAASDVLLRMRADGIDGVPRDADTLAELLTAHGVFAPNPNATGGLKHYYKILPQMRGIPKQALEVVKIADTELVGLQLEGVDSVPVDLVGSPSPSPVAMCAPEPPPVNLPLELPLEAQTVVGAAPEAAPRNITATLLIEDGEEVSLDRFNRFGSAGLVLRKLVEQLRSSPGSMPVARIPEGIALGFPDAVASFCTQPQDFLASCEAQGLLISEKTGSRRFVRTRAGDQQHLPAQYVVLAPRVARLFPMSKPVHP